MTHVTRGQVSCSSSCCVCRRGSREASTWIAPTSSTCSLAWATALRLKRGLTPPETSDASQSAAATASTCRRRRSYRSSSSTSFASRSAGNCSNERLPFAGRLAALCRSPVTPSRLYTLLTLWTGWLLTSSPKHFRIYCRPTAVSFPPSLPLLPAAPEGDGFHVHSLLGTCSPGSCCLQLSGPSSCASSRAPRSCGARCSAPACVRSTRA